MTDSDRLRLAQAFDAGPGVPLESDQVLSIAADPEAARYWNQLERLRALARRHDPAARVPVSAAPPRIAGRPARVGVRPALWATLAVAAAAAVLLLFRTPRTEPIADRSAPIRPRAAAPAGRAVAERRATERRGTPAGSGEVRLYRWANDETLDVATAVRLILDRRTPARRPSSRSEIEAIRLANASSLRAPQWKKTALGRGLARHEPPHATPRRDTDPNT